MYLLLAAGMSIDTKDAIGSTLIHTTAAWGQEAMLRDLLKWGLKVNVVDHKNETPLHLAAASGEIGCVDALLEAGADVRATDNRRQTALHFAAEGGYFELISFLIRYGVDIEARDRDGWDAFLVATNADQLEFARVLLEERPNLLHSVDDGGYNAVHKAVHQGFHNLTTILLDMGIPIDQTSSNGDTALICAVKAAQDECLEVLLAKGADVNIKDAAGHSAFWYAVEAGDSKIARRLATTGAEYCKCAKCDAVLTAPEDDQQEEDVDLANASLPKLGNYQQPELYGA